jgi:hypothetical protein
MNTSKDMIRQHRKTHKNAGDQGQENKVLGANHPRSIVGTVAAIIGLRNQTEGFPCFFLSCKANARVKPSKTGHGPHSSQFLCRSMYCLCVYMCTVLLPPGGYPIAVKYIISYIKKVAQTTYFPHWWGDWRNGNCLEATYSDICIDRLRETRECDECRMLQRVYIYMTIITSILVCWDKTYYTAFSYKSFRQHISLKSCSNSSMCHSKYKNRSSH